MAPVLGYWPIRGLAEPIRYLLQYTGTKYEDRIYEYAHPPAHEKQNWYDDRLKLGLDFPDLPYYIDGDLKMTQSTAILRHLARKHHLVATSEEDLVKQEIVEQQAVDIRIAFIMLCYGGTFEKSKVDYIKNLPTKLKLFSDYLGSKQWIMGDKLTYVDFLVYDAIDFQRLLVPDCIDKLTNLKEYMKRFENVPQISNYMKNGSFTKWPKIVCGPSSAFANKQLGK